MQISKSGTIGGSLSSEIRWAFVVPIFALLGFEMLMALNCMAIAGNEYNTKYFLYSRAAFWITIAVIVNVLVIAIAILQSSHSKLAWAFSLIISLLQFALLAITINWLLVIKIS